MSPAGLDICKAHGITLLTLPPHTSHKLQPLDVAVYGPFKSYFREESDKFMVSHPGQTIGLKNIALLVGNAHQRAFTPKNIRNGFLATGIWPYNPDIFTDHDFITSSVSDRPNPSENEATNVEKLAVEDEPGPSTMYREQRTPEKQSIERQGQSLTNLPLKTPEELRPFPKSLPRKVKTTKRKQVKAKILTHTPNMQEIKEDYKKRKVKIDNKKVKKNVFEKEIKKLPNKKKRIEPTKSDSDSDSVVSSRSSDITDIEDQIREELEDVSFAQGCIEINDFILVKFPTKKSIKYYIAKVLEIHSDEYFVSFLRRKSPGYFFVFPDVPDTSMVAGMDAMKLPAPYDVGGTVRVQRKLRFPVNFSKYENIC